MQPLRIVPISRKIVGVLNTNLVLPLGPDHCRVFFDFYFEKTEGVRARKFITDSITATHQVQMEDQELCEEVQHGLQSRTYNPGRFSVKRKAGGYYFHQLLARKLRELIAKEATTAGK